MGFIDCIFRFFLSQASSIPGLYLGLMLKGLGMGLARAGNVTMLSLSVSKSEQELRTDF